MTNTVISDSLEEDILVNGCEKVIKLLLSHLARNNCEFISVNKKMVIKNMEITVRGSIIVNYVILSSIEFLENLPNHFTGWDCIPFHSTRFGPSKSHHYRPNCISTHLTWWYCIPFHSTVIFCIYITQFRLINYNFTSFPKFPFSILLN